MLGTYDDKEEITYFMDLVISIVTYNNEKIIRGTIESIIKNTSGITYRIVVFDNDSKDRTVDIIKVLQNEYGNIDVIASEYNYGFGIGHNKAIRMHNSKYNLIYNPDVYLKNNILSELFEYMEKNTEVGMVTPIVKYPNGDVQYLCKRNPTVFDLFARRFLPQFIKKILKRRLEQYEMRETGYNKEFVIPYATGCFMFFRKDVLTAIEGFDPNIFLYFEDADITRRANMVSKCVFYPYNYIEHLWGKGSYTSTKLMLETIKSAVYYFNKWGWKWF